jgi:hypothetical protein
VLSACRCQCLDLLLNESVMSIPRLLLLLTGATACSNCAFGTFSNIFGSTFCHSCWMDSNSCSTADTLGRCNRRCSRLRIRMLKDGESILLFPGERPLTTNFVCRFGDGPKFPQIACTLPPGPLGPKSNCSFESSLSCRWSNRKAGSLPDWLECVQQPTIRPAP